MASQRAALKLAGEYATGGDARNLSPKEFATAIATKGFKASVITTMMYMTISFAGLAMVPSEIEMFIKAKYPIVASNYTYNGTSATCYDLNVADNAYNEQERNYLFKLLAVLVGVFGALIILTSAGLTINIFWRKTKKAAASGPAKKMPKRGRMLAGAGKKGADEENPPVDTSVMGDESQMSGYGVTCNIILTVVTGHLMIIVYVLSLILKYASVRFGGSVDIDSEVLGAIALVSFFVFHAAVIYTLVLNSRGDILLQKTKGGNDDDYDYYSGKSDKDEKALLNEVSAWSGGSGVGSVAKL